MKKVNNFDELVDLCKNGDVGEYIYKNRKIKIIDFCGIYDITFYIAIDESFNTVIIYNYDDDIISSRVDPLKYWYIYINYKK